MLFFTWTLQTWVLPACDGIFVFLLVACGYTLNTLNYDLLFHSINLFELSHLNLNHLNDTKAL